MAGRLRYWVFALAVLLAALAALVGLLWWLPSPRSSPAPAAAPAASSPFPRPRPRASPRPRPSPSETAIKAERQALYARLVRRPPLELLKRWLAEAAREPGSANLRAVLPAAFVTSLTAAPQAQTSELAAPLAEALLKPELAPETRTELAYALAASGTVSGLQALLHADSAAEATPEGRAKMVEAIAWLGADAEQKGLSSTDLSPVLETGLSAAIQAQDRPLALAVASTLGQLGSSTGAQAAFEFALSLPDPPDDAGQALQEALAQITNPAAIPYLSTTLAAGTGDSRPVELSGLALTSIGTREAVQPLLEWLRTAPDEVVPLVREWFANLHTAAGQALAERAVQEQTFESAALRTALEAQLAANRRSR